MCGRGPELAPTLSGQASSTSRHGGRVGCWQACHTRHWQCPSWTGPTVEDACCLLHERHLELAPLEPQATELALEALGLAPQAMELALQATAKALAHMQLMQRIQLMQHIQQMQQMEWLACLLQTASRPSSTAASPTSSRPCSRASCPASPHKLLAVCTDCRLTVAVVNVNVRLGWMMAPSRGTHMSDTLISSPGCAGLLRLFFHEVIRSSARSLPSLPTNPVLSWYVPRR
jgi:hypothetical protein